MEGGKPLIFIKPYTKTLAKLKEVLEESSEQQGTEIYEIDDLQEAIQLIPQIGQSLVIAAHPRKTAMLLQASRAHIKKLQTKVLLISPKPIPRRTVDKFMKVGLTECIVEPIVPKTLQYKVNLLIRSIVIKKEESSFEKKFDSDTQSSDDSDMEVKEMQRKLRENADAAAAESKKEYEESEEDLYGKKERSYQEEEIAGYYKGKMKSSQSEDEEEEEEDENSRSEDHIDAYYKGKLAQSEESEEEAEEKDKKELEIEEDDVHALASKVNLLLEEESDEPVRTETENEPVEKKAKKKAPALSLEEEQERKLKKQLEEEAADFDDVASHHLDLIDDLSDTNEEEAQAQEDKKPEKKAKSKLDIEAEKAPKKEKATNEERPEKAAKKRQDLDIEDEDLYSAEPAAKKEEKERKQKDTVSIDIDDEDESEEGEETSQEQKAKKEKKSKVSIALEEDQRPQEDEESQAQVKEKKAKDKVEIDLEEDLYSNDKEKSKSKEESAYTKPRKNLDIENDLSREYEEAKRKQKEAREKESAFDLDVEDDSDKNRRRAAADEDNYQTRSSGYTENIQDQGGNRADAHSDKIQTYYDSRKGVKHGDDEWQATEREQQFDDNWKRTKNNEFIMPEKEAFGEQTIDYSDLKKQFDAIEYELAGKKKIGEFDENESGAKPLGFAAAISADEAADEDILEEQEAQAEEEEQRPIQEAHVKTGPTLVKSLRLYLVPNLDREKVLLGILELLRDDLGVLVAIKYGKGSRDGKLKIDTFEGWLDEETKSKILSTRTSTANCPLLPTYSDKTFEQNKTTFYYPYTEGITTFAWAECYLPAGTDEEGLKGIEAVLESARGVLLDEFHELGGTGPYAELRKKEAQQEGAGAKVLGFFGKLFGKKKAS